jgi:hypothetical protein
MQLSTSISDSVHFFRFFLAASRQPFMNDQIFYVGVEREGYCKVNSDIRLCKLKLV